MSDRELQPIELFAIDISELAKARGPLNRFAANGYAPLIGTYVPTKTGGMIVYVLGDVSQVGPAREVEEETDVAADNEVAEQPAVDSASAVAPEDLKPEVTVTTAPGPSFNGNGNGAHVPEALHGAEILG